MLTKKEYINITASQINNLEKQLVEIKKDSGGVLSMILNMQNIYTKYLHKANKVDKKYDEIYTYMLELEQKLHISNKKRE